MPNDDPLLKLSKVVLLYPLALMVCWVPASIYGKWRDTYYTQNGHYPKHFILISNYFEASVCLYGPLLSLIFYIYTEQARYEWMKIYRYILYRKSNDDCDDDMRSTASSSSITNDVIMNPIDDTVLRISEGQL